MSTQEVKSVYYLLLQSVQAEYPFSVMSVSRPVLSDDKNQQRECVLFWLCHVVLLAAQMMSL